jgi:hypothetical protein
VSSNVAADASESLRRLGFVFCLYLHSRLCLWSVGARFCAGGFNRSFSLGCESGGQVEVILTGRVSWRFSDDGSSISAEEVVSYLVVRTGEQVELPLSLGRHRPVDEV